MSKEKKDQNATDTSAPKDTIVVDEKPEDASHANKENDVRSESSVEESGAQKGASKALIKADDKGGALVQSPQANRDEPAQQEEQKEEKGGWFQRLFSKKEAPEQSPLELRIRLLDELETALKPHRSERPLPFNRLSVHILPKTGRHRTLYESAVESLEPTFSKAARDRLREAGFSVRPEMSIKTQFYTRAPKRLQREFEAFGEVYVELQQQAARTSALLTVLEGYAEQETYRIKSANPINIGRLREVVDDRYGQVVRTNQVAFLDPEDELVGEDDKVINETVSRKHARIEYNEHAGAFVLHNQAGRTSIGRQGFPQPVRVGKQPVSLEHGDLIYLGRACLQFETKRR